MRYDVIIIGAGPAGCSAAIQLAERGFGVLLLEKRQYPVHKLCGEFLSVEVMSILRRLGVLGAVRAAGAHPIHHASITTPSGAFFQAELPGTALGLSRFALDDLLFKRAAAAGATCLDGTRVRKVTGSFDEGFAVCTHTDTYEAAMVLGAYGKRDVLDRKLARTFLDRKESLVAFKAHFQGARLPGVVELHAFPGGYCGLAQVEHGLINACWVAHAEALKAAGGSPEDMIAHLFPHNPVLAGRFETMARTSDAFLAASQISFVKKPKFEGDVCMIGDTTGMIAPLCGDGMAMALRGADLAVPLAARLLEDGISLERFKRQYIEDWDAAFNTRLQLGRLMQMAGSYTAAASVAVRACSLFPPLGRWLIRKTRG